LIATSSFKSHSPSGKQADEALVRLVISGSRAAGRMIAS
jgi:hypothetical protein